MGPEQLAFLELGQVLLVRLVAKVVQKRPVAVVQLEFQKQVQALVQVQGLELVLAEALGLEQQELVALVLAAAQ